MAGWTFTWSTAANATFSLPIRRCATRSISNNRDGTFTDVTAKAGVAAGGYGQGVAVGDYDGDGFPDMYVTQYGRSILYHNNGDGTFTDVTEKAGVAAPGWASSAVWFDYDNDGRLDLFVGQFVEFSKALNKTCGSGEEGKHGYCIPASINPMPSWLFHNNGDGTFTDVSRASGIAKYPGKAWGVVATDINNDGRMDLFVANDTVANFLFMNRGGESLKRSALRPEWRSAPTAGPAQAWAWTPPTTIRMAGWTCSWPISTARFIPSIRTITTKLLTTRRVETGVGMATRLMSGWGLKFFDYDNDGNLDLFLANGNPDDLIEGLHPGVTYKEPPILMHNTGRGFENVSAQSGPIFSTQISARGMAIGDFDNDGAVDVLIAVNGGPPILLRNQAAKQSHWLGVRLIGKKSNPDAIGARISYQAGDLKRSHMKVGGGSYLSSQDPRMVLGLGARRKIDWVEVKWPLPSGAVERFTDLPIDRYITIVEGAGKWK